MGQFLDELTGTTVGDDEWRLERPLRYQVNEVEIITVPVGFVTDLASVPIGFRNMFPVNSRSRKAAGLHDYLYSLRGTENERPRAYCDKIFLQSMRACGVSWFKRNMMYAAVRGFGWWFWRKGAGE